ncbi:ubiquitin-activating protein [Grosmannia clavigera kw1407]|uniref:Ubiquitin-activating protein n=1 Tax=Grosmannia clavigera (strain kw1407 / UAMH 11150) TaxID=655863 RepID=F0XJ86_GROCL|nr:ubiquitin-activating protein [Grosmannia clavigera kw1407]EFX02250.1 ubiquitin-activating protein [Grosmannia clavigera kw1407]
MTSVLAQAAASRHVQLAATAVLSGAVVATALLGYQHHTHEARLRQLKRAVRQRVEAEVEAEAETETKTAGEVPLDAEEERALALARRAQAGDYAEEVILEQLTRNQAFLTAEGLARVRAAVVVVVGCGGVGSHCAAALARSGVGRLRLVDFDQVSLSSLNRHAVATLADVGRAKVQVLARRLQAVAPWVQFDQRQAKFDGASAGDLLGGWQGDATAPTFIIDAIDNIDSKVELLRYCHAHGLAVVASMGAGTKSDPTKVVVGDLGGSAEDRLSRATRRRLKLLGITSGITAVYSTEPAGDGKAALLPLPDDQYARLGRDAVRELGALPDFRVRILPVLGTMPAVFGYTLANHVLLTVAQYPYEYSAVKGRDKLYDQILGAVHGAEERLIRAREARQNTTTTTTPSLAVGLRIPLTLGDVAFLVEDVYRGRSAVSGLPTRTTLVRWQWPSDDDGSAASLVHRVAAGNPNDPEQRSTRLSLADLVCMTREEAARHHDQILLAGRPLADLYDAPTLARIDARRREAAAYEEYRL